MGQIADEVPEGSGTKTFQDLPSCWGSHMSLFWLIYIHLYIHLYMHLYTVLLRLYFDFLWHRFGRQVWALTAL